ncbi:MAG: hypothetical protein ACHQ7N_16130 [Candidatus Methylomirabilales bacterium]
MMRALAGLLALVIVGFPILVAPSKLTGALAVIAGTLCSAGIAALSIPLLATGAGLSLVGYALALWPTAGSPDPLGALVLGVALSLLFQVVGFAARFRGAAVDSHVFPGQVRYWVSSGVGAAVAGILLSMGAGGIALRLPLPAYPAAVALGALAAFLGAVWALTHAPERMGPASGEERG